MKAGLLEQLRGSGGPQFNANTFGRVIKEGRRVAAGVEGQKTAMEAELLGAILRAILGNCYLS